MIRLAISVEGPTEREFFTRVVCPYLQRIHIQGIPIVITTKRVLDGPNHKGGDVSVSRVIPQIRPLLTSFDYVTTFYDFYGFKTTESLVELAEVISNGLGSPRNFILYIQKYEFESLLFTDCQIVGTHFQSKKIEYELADALSSKGSPEDVNNSRETCPSKRIINACKQHLNKNYDKVFDGPSIAEKIGLEKIRGACPLFGNWLSRIESLNTTS